MVIWAAQEDRVSLLKMKRIFVQAVFRADFRTVVRAVFRALFRAQFFMHLIRTVVRAVFSCSFSCNCSRPRIGVSVARKWHARLAGSPGTDML